MRLGERLSFHWRWRMWHPLQRAGFVLGASAPAAGVAMVAGGQGFGGVVAIVAMPVIGISVAFIGHRFLAKRLRQGALPCPRCRYDLRGLAGACPECGEAFEADDLREAWRICMVTIV